MQPEELCCKSKSDGCLPELSSLVPETNSIGTDIEHDEPECLVASTGKNTGTAIVTPKLCLSILTNKDDDSGSTDATNVCSNCSPSSPNVILDDLVGIVRGDIFLSILDCPGSKTRKKRIARNDHRSHSYPWGEYALRNALSCIRPIRKENRQVLPDHMSKSSFASEKYAKNLRHYHDNGTTALESASPKHGKSLLSGSFKVSSGSKSPHRSQILESEALEYLKNDDYESALSDFEQMQQIYDEYCNSYDEGMKEHLEYKIFKGLTVFNIGIVHLLNAEYNKALVCFENVEKSCRDVPNNSMIDPIVSLMCAANSLL
jgi:hypothetical protein